jgi:ankyrin repeat protein
MKRTKGLAAFALGLCIVFSGAASAQEPRETPARTEPTDPFDLRQLPDTGKAAVMNDYAMFGKTDVLISLIDKFGFSPNAADENGVTPLISAARNGQANAALALISRGADKTARDKIRQLTAEEWAQASGHADTAFMIKSFEKPMLDAPAKSAPPAAKP